MLPIRIRACSESDLRMLGNLARNIQRVLPVTQADIDAAAALGEGWVVWKVIEVNDPIDNLRGGTQLVIKQNSITPGQNVRRVLIVQGPGSETVVVRGSDYIALPDAIANSLQYVKAFGGTEQRNLPAEYTQLEYLGSDSQAYIDTGIAGGKDTLTIECKFMYDTFVAYGGVYGNYVSDSHNGIRCILANSENGIITNNNTICTTTGNTELNCAISQIHTVISKHDTVILDGVATSIQNTGTGTENANNIALFNRSITNPNTSRDIGLRVYGFKIYDADVLVSNLIPCRRKSDSVLGMYDTVSGTFFTNAGTGVFVAGTEAVPTPDTPMDIVSNNGVLKARHQSGLPLGYTLLDYIESSGTQYIDTGYFFTDIATETVTIDFMRTGTGAGSILYGTRKAYKDNGYAIQFQNSGNTYIQYGENDNGIGAAAPGALNTRYTLIQTGPTYSFRGASYTSTGATPTQSYPLYLFTTNNGGNPSSITPMRVYSFVIKDANNVEKLHLVPAKNSSNVVGMYDLVSGQFFTNQGTGTFTAGSTVSDPVEIYTDGTVETIGDTIGNTATAEMLLKVGDYQDVQSILDGVVTRNIGIKVLDGTEGWQNLSGYFNISKTDIGSDSTVMPLNSTNIICSHFETKTGAFVDGIGIGGSYVNFKYDSLFTTVAQFKQFLANQYAAGTPVIIVYPLETATTETVTGQTLQVQAGDNTLEITQASLSGLELEAEYTKVV